MIPDDARDDVREAIAEVQLSGYGKGYQVGLRRGRQLLMDELRNGDWPAELTRDNEEDRVILDGTQALEAILARNDVRNTSNAAKVRKWLEKQLWISEEIIQYILILCVWGEQYGNKLEEDAAYAVMEWIDRLPPACITKSWGE